MKPSWDEAPVWANWLAMDRDWQWNWYEQEPEWTTWYWDGYARKKVASVGKPHLPKAAHDDAIDTLEARPCSPPPSP